MGLVTGPHAGTPPHPQPVGSGPRQPAQRAGSRRWESARPRTPHTQARVRAVGLVKGPHARTPPHPQPEGGQSGVGERPTPDIPHPGKGRPPRAPSCRPHSTQERALCGW